MKIREDGEIDPPDALNADVSSPSSINDAIMVGLREATDDPTVYPFHYATWEMNPNITFDSLRSEMRNKVEFERDYGAVPPLGANQFISHQIAVEKCQLDYTQTKYVTWSKQFFTDEFGTTTMYLKVNPVIQEKTRPRILTVDTGLANNSFAVALWSYDRESKMPVCDVALECMPQENSENERILVNFPLMFEHCIVPLVTNFRIVLAAYDRWNSIEQVQRLRKDYKVEAIQYNLKWADFLMVRSRIIDSTIRFPRMEMGIEDIRRSDRQFDELIRDIPMTHMALQILTVREAGRKVAKPINGTDDLFRCLCLAVSFILDPDYTAKFEQYGSILSMYRGTVGAVRSNRGEVVPMAQQQSQKVAIGVRKGFVPTLK